MKNILSNADLFISEAALTKIQKLVYGNPHMECGGFLIGTLSCDPVNGRWVGFVEDAYCIGRYGEPSTFTFFPIDALNAMSYIAKKYRQALDTDDDVDRFRTTRKSEEIPFALDTKRIIGNFHSHGIFDAFFSDTDEQMMRKQSTDEFYVVYSPSRKRIIGKFKDTNFNFYNAVIHHFNPVEILYDEYTPATYDKKDVCSAPTFGIVRHVYEKTVQYRSVVEDDLKKRFNFSTDDLHKKNVLVVGAGTLGNEIIKNLALSGVSDITIVDMDAYGYHNLPRSPMITRLDVEAEEESNKAIALAKRIVERCPFSIKVTAIATDITKLGWGFFEEFDLIMSPVDSFGIRKYVDRGCRLYGKTHITAGTGVQEAIKDRMLGDVIVSFPDAEACYLCTEFGNMRSFEARKSCSEAPAEVQPQVMGFSSTVAGIASSAALLCLLEKFHEYDNSICKDENGNHFYWKISASEIGLFEGDIEKDVNNLNSAVYRQKKSCEFHSVYNLAQKRFDTIKIKRNYDTLLIALKKLFGGEIEDFCVDLEFWGLVYYLAYVNDKRYKLPQGAIHVYLHEREEYEIDYTQLLPRDHIYRITVNGDDDNFKLVRIVFEGEQLG